MPVCRHFRRLAFWGIFVLIAAAITFTIHHFNATDKEELPAQPTKAALDPTPSRNRQTNRVETAGKTRKPATPKALPTLDASKDKARANLGFDTNKVIFAPTSGGKKKVRFKDGTEGEIGAVKIFNRPFEQSLLAASRAGGSGQMLKRALLMYTDEQIMKMLKEPVNIDANVDAEGVIERKLNVQIMKEQLLKYIENGGTIEDAFNFYAKQAAEERAIALSARKELRDLQRSGDGEAVKSFIEQKNVELKERGLPLLRMPAAMKNDKGQKPKE